MELGLFLQPATKPGRPLADTVDWNIDVIRHADVCGFSEVWVGQHITSPWEPLPSPQQIIARAIGETTNIRLGTGVEVLYQSHPVRLATELAQLDHMARGRLMQALPSEDGVMVAVRRSFKAVEAAIAADDSRKHSEVWGDVALESQDHHDPSCRMDEKNYQIWGCDYLVRSPPH